MHSESTQPSLLSRVRDPSDVEAWRAFDAKYRDLILRYCRRRGLSVGDAEDIHQMAMLKMFRTLPGFTYDRARGRFRDYLYRVVRSAVSDLKARPKGTTGPVVQGVDEVPDGACPADAAWEQEWADHHFRLAMAEIRRAFEARSIEMFERLLAGDSVETVATAFQTTSQAVHKVKQRIRDRMRELIEAQIREEDEV